MIRHFTDSKGTAWRVWDVWPTSRGGTEPMRDDGVAAFPTREFTSGWLCFECDSEKRRLTPIPPEWELCETCVLEEMCGRAGFVTSTPRDGPAVGN